MIDVVVATLASATPMGQQEYEQQLIDRLPDTGLTVRNVRVRSLRSSLTGEARLPLGAVSKAPAAVQHAMARVAYGRAGLVHRCDLRLPAAAREVVTVHDLAPLRFPDEGEIPARAADMVRRARVVICPSYFAAEELRALFGINDAVVIHNGIDDAVWRDVPASVLDGLGLPETFVLQSGGATQRKNLGALAEAWALIADQNPSVGLVLCGPPDPRRNALFGGLPRVHILGRVPRNVHLALMSSAMIVVVPSTYEGFGFPALEAMARGTPVVAANCASLPEICGDAAFLARPNASGIASGLRQVLSDAAVRADMRLRGHAQAQLFSWIRSVDGHAAVIRTALER